MTVQSAQHGTSEALSPEGARVADAFAASIAARQAFDTPYRHYLIENVFPADVSQELAELPFAAPVLNGLSGKRELHNDQRTYFDAAGVERFPVMRGVAEALQSQKITRLIHDAFDAPIDDTFLRLEYAQDIDGFWLEPHTDLGVKKFTCLIYLSEGPGHDKLGTDIYWERDRHYGTSPFKRGGAMIFVPGDNTWHGFVKRPIEGVRRSVILNYVTHDWRAREQLSYPNQPVRI
ncbi:MAG: 2OG-Fe(II) oxygenase [Hyphomicrobiales bacterium]|nr:2OG-Fe(II) oxygenase [Hyphomicrobiales bacterium]